MSKEQIVVRGYGEVEVMPDKGFFNVDINVRGLNEEETYKEAVNTYNKTIDLLKSIGVEEDNILRAKGVSVYASYNKDGYYSYGGFTVSHKDFNKLAEIKSNIASVAGARVSTVSYSISDRDKYYNEAMKLAIMKAKEKASMLAEFAEVKLGGIIQVNEVGPSYNSFSRGAMMEDSLSAVATNVPPKENQVSPDKQKIGYDVTVSFAIK